jgi:O-antigen ligase
MVKCAAMLTRKRAAAEAPPRLAGVERAALAVMAAGAVAIPLIVGRGDDPFRLPKELVFRAEAVALLAVVVFWATARARTWRIGRGPELAVVAAALLWTILATLFSTNRALSADSLITVLASAVIFVVTCVAAQGLSFAAVDVLMIGACANAATVILQERRIWSPFQLAISGQYANVGFLGNTNDVGMFLLPASLAAVIVAFVGRGRRRWIYAALAAVLYTALAVSASRMAIAAAMAGLFVFAVMHSWRAAAVAVAAVVLLAVPALLPSTFVGQRVRDLADAARRRDYQRLLSERLVPFLAAADMTLDHPLLGVGPGCFKYHFMAYRLALPSHYPPKWTQGWPMNFGEVHNDHLQVSSETGLAGYALFLAALGVVAGVRLRRRARPAAPRAAFARALRWPLAVGIFVLCLAQFPMELAAPRLMMLSFGALCVAWDRDDAA